MTKICLTCGCDINSGKFCDICTWKNNINERTIKSIKNQRKKQNLQTTFDKSHNEIAEIIYKLIEENENYKKQNDKLKKKFEELTIENEKNIKYIRKLINENVCDR